MSKKMETILVAVLVALGVFVALMPSLTFAPVPKMMLLFLVSLLPAILFGSKITAQFNLEIKGMVISTGGMFASILILMLFFYSLTKPEQQIAVFQIYENSQTNKFILDLPDSVSFDANATNLFPTKYQTGNTLILIFPEQLGSISVRFKSGQNIVYRKTLSYAGNRESIITLSQADRL